MSYLTSTELQRYSTQLDAAAARQLASVWSIL